MISFSLKPKCFIVDPYTQVGGGKVSQANLKLCVELTNNFSEVSFINLEGNLFFSCISFFWFILNMNSNKFRDDIIIIQGIFELQYLIADLFLYNKKRLVIIPRGAFVPSIYRNTFINKPFLKILLWKAFIKKRFFDSGYWVTTSDLEQERFEVIGANMQNSLIIPDSLNNNRLDNASFIPSKTFIESNYLLFVGRISKEKNLFFLIELMKRLVEKGLNKKLIILGPISDIIYYNSLVEKINLYSLNEYIIFRSANSNLELAEYYSKSDCVLLPSYIESFGLVVLEAIQFSKVIFVSQNVPLNFISPQAGKQLYLDIEIWSYEIFNFYKQGVIANVDYSKILAKFSIEKISAYWQNATKLLIDGRL